MNQLETAITDWSKDRSEHVQAVVDAEAERFGLHLKITKPQHLKEPLNFLYDLARQCQCDFVLGILAEDEGDEEICYFGKHEGKPDMFEIASYLGLE